MITDAQIDKLFDEFERLLEEAEQPLTGLCVVVNFDSHAHVLGVGPKEPIENIVACIGGNTNEAFSKREIN